MMTAGEEVGACLLVLVLAVVCSCVMRVGGGKAIGMVGGEASDGETISKRTNQPQDLCV